MQRHLNQQHNVKLTRWTSLSATSYSDHAAQLWKPVKVQTFFRGRRYLRYFVVQPPLQQEEKKKKKKKKEEDKDEVEEEEEQTELQRKQADA